ncbi:uncharacterized protein BDW70DRAFT_156887 [Aspergillus foveolatus]|uniref:uncharacterized protein n=1 Tax=Aspergillus foveolatus TaxID=210207 RepID=UPI003CCCDD0B
MWCAPIVAEGRRLQDLKALEYFTAHPDRLDTAKDLTYTAVGSWVNIAKDSNTGDYGWDEDDVIEFESYMGDVWRGWKNSTEMASRALFNGSDSTITLLTKMMKDGKLIEGSTAGNEVEDEISSEEREAYIEKSFYAYVIPLVWQKSGQRVIVIDTDGLACDNSNPVSDYLGDSTANVTRPASRKRDARNASGTSLCVPYKFSVPPGLDTLGTTLEGESVLAWGGLEALGIVAS